ncbi:MAG: chemotaxis protein CheA [Longimicrobiales bacterium]
MQPSRLVDLYVAESREHLSLLSRGILGFERGSPGALDEAFRAAHTLKGLASAMGHTDVALQAHTLEDYLTEVRDGRRVADAGFIDTLLTASDALADAVDAALREQPPPADSYEAFVRAPVPDAPDGSAGDVPPPPASATVTARFRFDPDTPIRAARAAIARRNAERAGGVVGAWPDSPDADPDEFLVYLSPAADFIAIDKAIRAAGNITELHFEPATHASSAAPDSAAAEAAPVAFVRVARDRLDELAEGVAELSVLHERERLTHGEGWATDRAGGVLAELQRIVLDLRMVPVSTAFERFHRLVRDALRSVGKEADFTIEGAEISADQAILDAIVDPLVHLLRNAVDHGLEIPEAREAAGKPRRGSLRLNVERERNSVRITLADDGAGIARDRVMERAKQEGLVAPDAGLPSDDELLRLMSLPGFSTAAAVTELSGRGVGLDVVVARVRSLGGAIEMASRAGQGTTFTIRLPVTLSLAHALRVRVGSEDYAIALTHVSEAISLEDIRPHGQAGRETIEVRGERVALIRLGRVLGTGGGQESAAVVAELGERRVALAVDALVGHEKIVVKSFDPAAGTIPVFAGATLLADGRPALLIDPLSVA